MQPTMQSLLLYTTPTARVCIDMDFGQGILWAARVFHAATIAAYKADYPSLGRQNVCMRTEKLMHCLATSALYIHKDVTMSAMILYGKQRRNEAAGVV